VRCLEKDFYHCLDYFSFPKELLKKVRTTNVMERDLREIRRGVMLLASSLRRKAPKGSSMELPMTCTRMGITCYLQSQRRSRHDPSLYGSSSGSYSPLPHYAKVADDMQLGDCS
jgi:hypothetical protein